jgi:hypothetical protein
MAMKSCRGGALVLLSLLALAPGAQAAQRYAAPTGSGTACTQPAPCSLEEAINNAKASEEVIVGGGTYELSKSAIVSAEGVYVHGDLGSAPPVINAALGNVAVGVYPPKSRLAHVDVVNSAKVAIAVYCGIEATVEGVRATTVGETSHAVSMVHSCTARNSTFHATGKGSTAILASCESTTLTARNVTAVASGEGSVGIRAYNTNFLFPKQTCVVDVRNAIASGDGADIQAQGGLEGETKLEAASSNFDVVQQLVSSTVVEGPGNQTSPPIFVNAGAGDYREAPGSPTIDAGVPDPLSEPYDLDGNPRTVGPAPDIGAYEYVPPPPPVGRIELLKLSPQRFRSANLGGAIVSARKRRVRVGATVAYSLSAAATVSFTVERRAAGRRRGRRCVKQTRANRRKRRCARFTKVGGFSHDGATGVSRFKFSGRVHGRALKPGRYRLLGSAGGATKRVAFRIVR